MGFGADDSWSWTKPIHRVTVHSFQMAKTLVTFGQYKKCVGEGACTAAHITDGSCSVWTGSKWEQGTLPASFQGDDQPVVCVDWEQAQAFAKWAGGRLPSDAEWEFAARSGGNAQKYPWGDEKATCERAVIDAGGKGCGRNATWPVCSKPAGNTKQGLCDMAGNVWEWVQDWHHDSYNGAPTDGSAWESPASSDRVLRGGSWYFIGGYARSADRGSSGPGNHNRGIGFRPARSIPLERDPSSSTAALKSSLEGILAPGLGRSQMAISLYEFDFMSAISGRPGVSNLVYLNKYGEVRWHKDPLMFNLTFDQFAREAQQPAGEIVDAIQKKAPAVRPAAKGQPPFVAIPLEQDGDVVACLSLQATESTLKSLVGFVGAYRRTMGHPELSSPGKQSLQFWLSGLIYFQHGDLAKARKEWGNAISLDSSNEDARAGIRRLDKLEGKP
jgi:formylglycine-generating enzyme required for sulfatase activity